MHLVRNGTNVISTFRTIPTDYEKCYQRQYETYTVHFTFKVNTNDTINIRFENNHNEKVTLIANNSFFEGYRIK